MGNLVLAGASSGSTTITPTDGATATLTLPSTTGTLLTSTGTITTATNLAGGSNGTIPYQSASGTTQMLASGTSGYVLQSNGVGAPSWVAPSGDIVLIKTASFAGVANTSTTFDGVFTSTYKTFKVVVRVIYGTSSSCFPVMNLRVSGSTNTAANHNYSFASMNQGSGVIANSPSANSQTSWYLPNPWVAATSNSAYWMEFTGVGISSPEIMVAFSGMSNGAGTWYCGGLRWEGSAITPDGFIITATNGTMTGTIDIYGYK
jgi:hypothetical protein